MQAFSVVIPNYNGGKYLHKCLNSLIKTAQNCQFEVILIDNGSSDESLNIFSNFNITHKKLIKNLNNLGFATAINQGVAKSQYPWILALNNDITFHKNFFQEISPHLNTKYAAIAGAVLNSKGNKIESLGLKLFPFGKCENIKNGQPIANLTPSKPYEVWGLNAASTFYQKSIFQKVSGFDEKFFAYLEDVDLSFRLRQLGYLSLMVPNAHCYHLGGGTSNQMGHFRQKQAIKNWVRFIFKNYSPRDILLNLPGIIKEQIKLFGGLAKALIQTKIK